MRKQSCRHARLVLRPITLAVLVACAHGASANPTGPQVAAGSATFQSSGAKLTVTNAPGTIINWQSFSIGSGEHTRFLQQSASSAVLNRVVGADASAILGSLTSNGRVFLVNPHGIIFGAGARIDTAGFIASTLNMADRDFLEGRLKFEGGGNGLLRNEGEIRASGDIMLVGPTIENAGLIRSEAGSVLLAAGKSVTITSPDAQGVKFEVQAPTDSAVNLGTIEASSAAAMFAGTLVHSGDIRAETASLDGGRVALVAQKEAIVQSGGVISANGAKGGEVTVQSRDLTSIAGTIKAKGSEAQGGTVQLLGNRVAVQSGASVDASGETGGGTILVGGDYQGKNAEVQNAWRTYIGPDSTMRADAISSGDGGKVIVWADDSTRFHGNISARGGARSGDGGFVETSGKNHLLVSASHVDTRAPAGKTGQWLLDPTDITVANGGPGLPGDANDFGDGSGSNITISPFTLAAAASDITLQANNDIFFQDAVALGAPNAALTAQAGRSILVNADISTMNGNITLTANDAGANLVDRATDAAQLTMAPGTHINAGAGNVTLRIGTFSDPGDLLGKTSGNIVVSQLTGANVSVLHEGVQNGAISRSDPMSLITAANGLHMRSQGASSAIGISTEPIVIATPRIEAQTLNGSGGIFLNAQGDLEIGGVAFYMGAERGVQTLAGNPTTAGAGAPISLTVNGNLTRFDGTQSACGAGGGSGGPICANNGNIALTAARIGAPGTPMHVDTDGILSGFPDPHGIVTATSTAVAGGGVFLHRRNLPLDVSGHIISVQPGQPIELFANSRIAVDASMIFPGSTITLTAGADAVVRFHGVTVTADALNVVVSGAGVMDIVNATNTVNAAFSNTAAVTLNGGLVLTGNGTDTGTYTLSPGTTLAIGGGTRNFSGTSFAGAGAVVVDGGIANFNTPVTLSGPLAVLSGTLGGTGAVAANGGLTLGGGTITGAGGVTVAGGTMLTGGSFVLDGALITDTFTSPAATLSLTPTGALTLNGVNDSIFTGSTISNNGTINLAGSGALVLNSGAALNNAGNFVFQSDADVRNDVGAATFANTASVSKSGAAGISQIGSGGLTFTNTAGGSVGVFSGTLAFSPASFTTNEAAINVFSGTVSTGALTNAVGGNISIFPSATLAVAGDLTNAAGATIGGAGSVTLADSGAPRTLTNLGTIDPGLSLGTPGTLTVDGNFTQGPGGTLVIDITTPAPGSFDVLAVSGHAALDGNLSVNHANGFIPSSDTNFNVITYASRSGDFATLAVPFGYASFYTGVSGSSAYTLAIGDIVNVWTPETSGAWETAGNWSLNHVPTIGEDVLIDVAGTTETVTISAGNQFARRLTSNENLTMNGGEIVFGPLASIVNAAFSVSGANVTFTGELTANSIALSSGSLDVRNSTGSLPRLAMTGGTLMSPDTLTITGPFSASGGMIAPGEAPTALFVTAGSTAITTANPTEPLTTPRNWLNTGTLALGGELRLPSGNFTNAAGGTLNVNTGALMDLQTTSLTNNGTLNINTSDELPFGAMPAVNPIVNNGTLNKNAQDMAAGADFVNLMHPFSNTPTGRINVNAGTLSVDFDGTQSGRIEIAQGAILNTDGALTNADGAVIGGRGTINLFGGTLTNNASVRPGLIGSGGTLTIQGDFTNSPGGTFDLRLGGQAPTEFGSLNVTGTANLGGTLALSTLPGYTAPEGDMFRFLTAAAIVNDFNAVTTTPAFINGEYFLKQPTSHLLGLGGPNTNSWITDVNGAWDNAANWSRQVVPNSPTARAFITRPIDIQVTIPAGAFEVDTLQSAETVFLNGTLTLGSASAVNGVLQINPTGILQGAGSMTLTDLSLGGTIANTGGVTVTNIAGPIGNSTIATGSRLTAQDDFLMVSGGTLNVASGAELIFAGGGDQRLDGGATITSSGTTALAGPGNLALNGGSQLTISPTGRFEFRSDADVNTTGGAPGTMTNSGTVAKTLGGGTSTIGPNLNFTNNSGGTLDAQSGTLEFAGVNTFNNGTQFIAAGTNAVTSNSTFNGTMFSNGLTLRSGVFSGNASFAGTTTWAGGTMGGVFTVPLGAVLNVSGADPKAIDGGGALLTNAGTAYLSGGVSIGGAGTLQNNGTIHSANAAGVIELATVFNNSFTVLVDGGTLRLTGNGTDVGLYVINPGTMLDIAGGTRVFDGALALNGAGAIQLSGGTLDVRTGTLPKLDMIGGTLTRSTAGDLTIAGAFNVSGGSVAPAAGAGLLITNGVTTVTQSVGVSRSWTNNGTLSTTGAGQINPSPGSGHQFVNAGTLNIAGSNPNPFGTAGDAGIVNAGTLNKSSGAVVDLVSAFSNTGVVNVDGGTLRLSGNGADTGTYSIDPGTTLDLAAGTRNLNAGSNVSGAGTVLMSGATVNANAGYSPAATTVSAGTANFNSDIGAAGLVTVTGGTANVNAAYSALTTTVSGGTLNLNGAAAHATNTLNLTSGTLGGTGNLTVNTAGTWSGGGLTGPATLNVANGAILTLTSDTSKLVNGATVANAGTVNLSGTGNLVLNNGATFSNTGTFDAQSDADVQNTAGGATFANAGTLRKSGGVGTTAIGTNQTFALTSAVGSTIDVQTGTLQVNGAFPTSSGTLNVESGATFATGGAALTNAGRMQGAGTIALAGATLTNNSVIAPGTATDNTATLTIGGNLAQGAGGSLEIDLGGTAPGQFDALSVSGSAALDGTLNLTTTTAYAPASGDTFNVLTAGTRTGNFATTTKNFANEVVPTYGAANLSLLLGPTNSNTWIFDVSDSWANAQRWSQGRAPLATDNVVISRPAGEFTITVPAGTFGALTLTSNENVTVLGAFGLTGASIVNGTLAVNGGTLQGAAPITVNGTLSLNGGTVANAGGLIVNGSTAVNGGVSQLAGSLTTNALSMTSGGLTVAAGSTLNLTGAQPKVMSGGTLTTAGTTNLSGTGDTTLSGGALWDNSGALNLGGDSRIVLAGDGAATLVNRGTGVITDTSTDATLITVGAAARAGKSFMNAGRLIKAVGSADVQTLDVPMTNTGTIEVLVGTLIANGFPANSGIVDIRSGAAFSTAGLPLTNSLLGLLKGNGTLILGGETFTNNGTVAPGQSPGALVIDGHYVQGPGGTLAIELGGSVPGTDYDLLRVTGTAALDGTLVVTQSPGTIITEGSAYEFMTYASATGDFAGYSVPQGFAFQTARGPTSYTLTNSVAVPPEQVMEAIAVTQNEAVVFTERVVVTRTADNTDADAERRTLEECR